MQPLPPRIERKIQRGPGEFGDPCWLWLGALTPDGYGRVRHDGRAQMAHRAVYELLVGAIPAGHDLDHLCRTRRCVRPEHLEPVTRAENLRRGAGSEGADERWLAARTRANERATA